VRWQQPWRSHSCSLWVLPAVACLPGNNNLHWRVLGARASRQPPGCSHCEAAQCVRPGLGAVSVFGPPSCRPDAPYGSSLLCTARRLCHSVTQSSYSIPSESTGTVYCGGPHRWCGRASVSSPQCTESYCTVLNTITMDSVMWPPMKPGPSDMCTPPYRDNKPEPEPSLLPTQLR
jgi:hypothetical protein